MVSTLGIGCGKESARPRRATRVTFAFGACFEEIAPIRITSWPRPMPKVLTFLDYFKRDSVVGAISVFSCSIFPIHQGVCPLTPNIARQVNEIRRQRRPIAKDLRKSWKIAKIIGRAAAEGLQPRSCRAPSG